MAAHLDRILTSAWRSWKPGSCLTLYVRLSLVPKLLRMLTGLVIGITLNVTPDSYYTTLFVVILFHQTFEGLALGTRIAGLPHSTCSVIKFLMAGVFTLITPVGMAIGVGVLSHFNGNDPSTILAIGTLDALSAGILLWVGLVEMLAHDWMHGDMLSAGWLKAGVGIASLVVGLAVMSLLGKWA